MPKEILCKVYSNMNNNRISEVLVQVDTEDCEKIAELLKSYKIPADVEDCKLPNVAPEFVGNFFFALVAICHQTTPLHSPPVEGIVNNKRVKGWDYLLAKFEKKVCQRPSLLSPNTWRNLTSECIRSIFYDEQYGSRLTDTERRACLLNDIGSQMVQKRWSNVEDIYKECEGRISIGKKNLIDTLRMFKAYSDPVHKKSMFFLALMKNTHTWRYVDEINLGPPVDYHEIRGHLRLGTVKILDEKLDQKLRAIEIIDEKTDVLIRKAVYEAIILISTSAGNSTPMQLHYLFWNIFRTLCTRRCPSCFNLSTDVKIPARYLEFAVAGKNLGCPFSRLCPSAIMEDRYIEPYSLTDFY